MEKDLEIPIIEIDYEDASKYSLKYAYANMLYIFPPSIADYKRRLISYKPEYGKKANSLELDKQLSKVSRQMEMFLENKDSLVAYKLLNDDLFQA